MIVTRNLGNLDSPKIHLFSTDGDPRLVGGTYGAASPRRTALGLTISALSAQPSSKGSRVAPPGPDPTSGVVAWFYLFR